MTHHHKEDKTCCQSNKNHTDKPGCPCSGNASFDQHNHETGNRSRRIGVGVSLVMLVLGLLFRHIEIAFFDSTISLLWFVAAYLIVALPVLKATWDEIRKGDFFNEFSLMSLATIGAFAIGEYPEAVGVMLFYTVGEIFQDMAVDKAKHSIKSLLDIRTDKASVLYNGQFVEMKPEEVEIGQTIRIKVGDRVPLDGVLLNEHSSFDTAALTGESVPRTIRKGQRVLAGMINLDYVSEIEVDRVYEDSALSRILYLTQDAMSRKAKTELFIRKFARIYTPIVFGLALLITFIPYFFAENYQFADWLYRGLVFLVISCPCALVISVPLGYFSGIGLASKNGILLKGANYLENLTRITHIAFDKTGTLTKGTFKVQQVEVFELTPDELVSLTAAIEQHSNHPIARAIVEFARSNNQAITPTISNLQEIAGQGLIADSDGRKVLVGNTKLLNNNNIQIPQRIVDIVETKVLVAIDGKLAGYMVIADEVRKEASELVARLKADNINTLLLSGDNTSIAQHIGTSIGIENIHGNLMPEDKVAFVEKLKSTKGNVVAYVGDGINDSPALALSDIGIAIGALGSQAAIEVADIVIQTDDIRAIDKARIIARKTQSVVVQNIVLAIGVKSFIMGLGAIGSASMWLAVFADVGVALLAILNSVRLIFTNKKGY